MQVLTMILMIPPPADANLISRIPTIRLGLRSFILKIQRTFSSSRPFCDCFLPLRSQSRRSITQMIFYVSIVPSYCMCVLLQSKVPLPFASPAFDTISVSYMGLQSYGPITITPLMYLNSFETSGHSMLSGHSSSSASTKY